MFPEGPNPYKLQTRPKGSSKLPLVLIHDGGGTTAGFWGLEPLNRDLWVIHNPNFWTEEPWAGGMDEMARHYIGLIQKAGISGRIILGGWSLGGYLSIAMARMLAEDSATNITVTSLMVIDVPYHIPWYDKRSPVVSPPKLVGVPPRVERALEYCNVLLHEWPVPSWEGPFGEDMDVQFTVEGAQYQIEPGHVLYKALGGDWKIKALPKPESPKNTTKPKNVRKPVVPPPAVLLRCINYTPTVDGGDRKCHIDLFRDEPLLGWEKRYPTFIKAVMEMKKDHYTLFDTTDSAQMKHITKSINAGLEIVESLEVLYDFM